MHGIGTFTWPDGRTYSGDYHFDQKHGKGTFRWPDGRVYCGEWKDGKQHGNGTFTNGVDEPRPGIWHAGIRKVWTDDDPKFSIQSKQGKSEHTMDASDHGPEMKKMESSGESSGSKMTKASH